MTREEINEFNPIEPYCFETDGEERWYQIGCIDGLDAADKEPNTSVLWHKPNDKPEEGELIVCVDTDCEWHTGSFDRMGNGEGYYAVWDYCILQCYWEDVKMWAYAKDLLPKGGEV